MARKTKVQRIQERTGLSDADMCKVLYVSRVTWWRWSTGKTPWAKIDPLRQDILEALWLVGKQARSSTVGDNRRRALYCMLVDAVRDHGWDYGGKKS